MKTLYIIRHAKSSWELDVKDHSRPLNEQGLNDAELIGKKLKTIVHNVDKIISSDAQRAKSTAQIILNHLDFSNDIFQLEPRLYDFDGNQVIDVIKKCDDSIDTLMIFGHNYALTSIVNSFGSILIDNLPTAGVVAIKFKVSTWENINKGKTILTVFPKELR